MFKATVYDKGHKTVFDYTLLTLLKERKNEQVKNFFERCSSVIYTYKDYYQATLLHYAAEYGNNEIVRHLINSGSVVDAQDKYGRTPLVLAVQRDHSVVVGTLLNAEAKLNITNVQGKNTVRLILGYKSTPLRMIQTLFKEVTLQQIIEIELAEKLRDAKFSLSKVASIGNLDLLKLSLDLNYYTVDTDSSDGQITALHVATSMHDVEMVKLLVERGADVDALDAHDSTPLSCLYDQYTKDAADEYLEILKVLMSRATVLTMCNRSGAMQIYNTLVHGSKEAVKLVLEHIDDLHVYDKDRSTIAHYLAGNCNTDVAETLRDRNLNVNTRNVYRETPLHSATVNQLPQTVEIFLEKGADVHARGFCNDKPLHALFRRSHAYSDNAKKCIKLLLEYGLDALDIDFMSVYDNISQYHNRLSQKAKDALTLMEPLIAQIAVTKARGIEIAEFALSYNVELQPSWVEYFLMCERQLHQMKLIVIYGSVTMFRFLKESRKKINAYVRNKELVAELEIAIEEFEENSPYVEVLRKSLAKAVRLAELTEGAINAICWLIDLEDSAFYSVAESDVEYLSNDDMKNLMISMQFCHMS